MTATAFTEGAETQAPLEINRRFRVRLRPNQLVGAVVAASAVAGVAMPLGGLLPRLGAPIIALVLGMALATVAPTHRFRPGLGFTSRYALQVAIVLLGATISLQQVVRVGASSLPVMFASLASALLAAALLGRGLGVAERLRVLIGVGTGICGASAIAAVSGIVDARASEIRYAISTIFAFNLVAVIAFPPLGHLLGTSQHTFGLWSGTAVNDTSSVVASGFAYGHAAGSYAIIVKLTRTTMIIPISVCLAAVAMRRRRTGSGIERDGHSRAVTVVRRVTPWFLVWFLAASTIDTAGVLGPGVRTGISHVGLGLTTVALAAVGLSSNLREMRQTGTRPLVLGACVWAIVTTTSLAMLAILGLV
jgi:uncharacterized integral membrane protein (TIGR00698 family)